MRNPKRNLTLTAMLISAGFLVTGCSGNQSPEPSTPPIASEQSPTVTESPSETATEMQTISKYEVTLDIPQTWSVEPEEECEGECHEYTQWNLKNQAGVTVLSLLPNTATSPDGDMNLYEREVLSSDPAPGLTFQPASVVAHHAIGTHQEDGGVTESFSMAIVDDEVLAKRGEQPDLDYFKTSEDAWPMLWVSNEYLEVMGYRVDGQMTRDQAEEFLNSEDFTYLNSIMKTVRITE